jgi:hypothetical protein
MKARRTKRAGYRRARLDPVQVAPLLEQIFPCGDGQPPIAVDGWFDRQGRPRRARADYANGWRIEFRLSEKGKMTSSSATVRLVSRKPSE